MDPGDLGHHSNKGKCIAAWVCSWLGFVLQKEGLMVGSCIATQQIVLQWVCNG